MYDDPYALGFEAFVNDQPIANNPFPLGTDAYYDWRAGWFDARQGEADFELNDY